MTLPIAIIGSGPAGMTAALYAAKAGLPVTVIDSNAQVGRKLLVTGSGRANLTNRAVSAEKYTSATDASVWLETLFAKFGPDDLLHLLDEMGLLTYSTADGWYYPVSESAQTVVTAFASALERAGVNLLLEHNVTAIRKSADGFILSFANQADLTCTNLLVAAGGKAYPTLGSRGVCFPLLKALGHTVRPLLPALGPLTCEMKSYLRLQGVRLDAKVSLFNARAIHDSLLPITENTGNLIFTQWGLNGPAVMDLSHIVARNPKSSFELRLNFLAFHEARVRQLIQTHRSEAFPLSVIPCSSLPPKLSSFILDQCGLKPETTLVQCNDAQLKEMMDWITAFPVTVMGVRDFDTCQVTCGGVPVEEVDPLTMQSRLVPGLFLAGETLDVIGPCGGYNLQFAFSTGAIAGMGMGKK
jgi:predicted Rossmann fold flavoprotein